MNPGTSQFNAQFPDVEEVMESKKLWTELRQSPTGPELWTSESGVGSWEDHVEHDARIAHELMDETRTTPETPLEKKQREAIWKLSIVIRGIYAMADTLPDSNYIGKELKEACTKGATAAEPFLED